MAEKFSSVKNAKEFSVGTVAKTLLLLSGMVKSVLAVKAQQFMLLAKSRIEVAPKRRIFL
jgi:hypothetical protein